MSDGAQRLLDVIDDPNALESFLGELTSNSELLPSAESVDNVVASLARSLEGDYEVDSPNETLFDSLDPSSNNLTDISQSYVPSDFDNVSGANSNNSHGTYSMGTLSNSDMSHQQQQELQNSLSTVITSGNEQYIVSNQSTNSTSNITSSLQQQQFSSANSNCDSSSLVSTSSNSQFIQQQNQQIQLNQSQQLLLQNNGNNSYIFNQDLMQKQTISTQSQQPQPTTSLSSSNVESQNQLSNNTTSHQNMISASFSNHNHTSAGHQIMTSSFQQGNEVSQQQGQLQQIVNSQGQQEQGNNSISSSMNSNNSTSAGTVNTASSSKELSSVAGTNNNHNSNSNNNSSSSQQIHQYANTNSQQQTTTTINQLGQTVVNVGGGTQLIANAAGNIVTAGQTQANILQQLQSANGGQSFITMDQALLAAGSGAFGGANLALVSAGGTPTYAVVPQFLQNTLMAQAQTVQTITKGPNGTFFQTAPGTQIVTASNVNTVPNVNVSVASTTTPAKPKQPPQLLPKPGGGKNSTSGATTSGNSGNSGTAVSSSDTANSSNNSAVTSTNTGQVVNTSNEQQQQNMVTQIFQQQQAQIQSLQNQMVVTSVASSMGSMMSQQQFTIGNTGLGQVVVSQNPAQQTQLTGTLVVNQYGQPMLLPSASTASTSGVQFIIRPQHPQPQMLTIQAPSGIGTQQVQQGKPIVRYVTQMPQLAQTSGYGIQQIQTPSGPQWVAVRYPQPATTLATTGGHFTQIDGNTLIQTPQIADQQQQQIQVQVQQQQQTSTPVAPQSLLSQPLTPQTPGQPGTPQPNPQPQQPSTPQPPPTPPVHRPETNTPDSSSEPPPAKKSKPRAKPKKQPAKVCLDLEQLLKQSGIMDEDLTDDFGDFGFGSSHENGFGSGMEHSDSSQMSTQETHNSVQHPVINTTGKNKSKNAGGSSKKTPSKSKKKKTPEKPKSPSPPPPPPPTSKSKKKKGGNQKADSKTDHSSSKNDPPKKLVSSIDSVTATIMAVAAGRRSPTPPPATPPPSTPSRSKSTPKNKSPSKAKHSKAQQSQSPVTPSPGSSVASSPAPSLPQTPLSIHVPSPMAPSPVAAPVVIPPVGGSPVPNGMNSQSQSIPRVVQTIQLTPQNQQLLRNIQGQITRLVSLPKRNDREQVALQKLIVLQQQVIATGIPVPNPSHLSNLTQSVNATVSAASLLATSAVSSSSAITAILGGTNALSAGSDSVASNSPNCFTSTSNVSVSQINTMINASTAQPNVSSNTQKLPSLKSTAPSVSIACSKAGSTINLGSTPSVVATEGNASSNSDISMNFVLGGPVPNTGAPKVTSSNDITEPSSNGGPEDNKENSMGGSQMVVVSSSLGTSTTTTNSLGQHHLQSQFSIHHRSAIDEKKAEEQRIANQKAEEEKRARWKKEEFEMLLKRDQQCVVKPDYEIPFCSKRDAVERLMKYHILRDRNDMNFEEFDADFGEKASVLLDKFHGMVAKHRALLLKESMKEVGCAERVMLERMFVNEEKMKLEQDRLLVSQGEVLELPPPPPSWVPKIQEMVEKEMKEMEQDSYVNLQVQSAIDSIIGFGNNDAGNFLPEESERIEYDSFGVPINNGAYNGMNSTSSADIDEAVRSILS